MGAGVLENCRVGQKKERGWRGGERESERRRWSGEIAREMERKERTSKLSCYSCVPALIDICCVPSLFERWMECREHAAGSRGSEEGRGKEGKYERR